MGQSASLQRRLLWPLALAGVAGGVTAAWMSHASTARSLDDQIRQRAELLVDSITGLARAVDETREMEEFITTLGSERDVNHIEVFWGDPLTVVASTDPSHVGKTVTELPAHHAEGALAVQKDRREIYRAIQDGDELECSGPLTSGPWPGSPGVVVVHMDAAPIRERVAKAALASGAQVLGTVLALTALTSWLLVRLVVRPARELRDTMARRAAGDPAARARVIHDDEIGSVAAALNGMLGAIEEHTREVRAGRERLATVIENMPVVFVGTDENGRVKEWNGEAQRVTGYGRDEVLAMDDFFDRLYPDPEYREALRLKYRAFRGDYHLWETTIRAKDGSDRTLVWSSISSRTPIPGLASWSVGVDITARKRAETDLRESEERLRFAQECAEAGIWTWDVKSGRVDWSDEFLRLRGLERADVEPSYEGWMSSLHAEDRESVVRALGESMNSGRGRFHAEYRVQHPTRGERWLSDIGRVTFGKDGSPARVAGVVLDITERRRIEEELRRSEESYRLRIEGSGVIAWEVDVATMRFTYVSGKAEALLGFAIEEWYGEGFWESRLHPDDRRGAVDYCKSETLAGRAHELEYRMIRKDGGIVWIHDIVSVSARDGRPVSMRGVLVDVTARKRAEEDLRASEKRLNAIIENAPAVAIQGFDSAGRVIFWNRAATSVFGWTAEEAVGKTLGQLMLDAEGEREWQQSLADMAASGRPSEPHEWEFQAKDGRPGWVYSSVFPIRAMDGTTQFVCMDVDVTARKRAEAERQALESKLRHTQKLESLGVLAGGIAHDFNNLLVGILGNAGLARELLPPDSPALSTIATIEQAAQRAAELTRQMLAYSGKGRVATEPIDLSSLVTEMVQLLEVSISKSAVVEFALAPDLPAIEGDPAQVRQVVMNLLTNASDALEGRPGSIRIATGVMNADRAYMQESLVPSEAPEGEYVFLEVRDTGVGMDNATLQRIFEPFFTTKFTGRGLGLAAVLGVVTGHKGAIKVRSEPGVGTTFRVLLPMAAAGQPRRPAPAGPVIAEPAGGTVLVVDDEALVRDMVALSLRTAGFKALTAEDGRRAIEVCRRHAQEIGVVVLDMTMPRMGGEEAFREVRKIIPGVGVILASGFAEQDVMTNFTAAANVEFLQKPFTVRALIDKVASMAARRAPVTAGRD